MVVPSFSLYPHFHGYLSLDSILFLSFMEQSNFLIFKKSQSSEEDYIFFEGKKYFIFVLSGCKESKQKKRQKRRSGKQLLRKMAVVFMVYSSLFFFPSQLEQLYLKYIYVIYICRESRLRDFRIEYYCLYASLFLHCYFTWMYLFFSFASTRLKNMHSCEYMYK